MAIYLRCSRRYKPFLSHLVRPQLGKMQFTMGAQAVPGRPKRAVTMNQEEQPAKGTSDKGSLSLKYAERGEPVHGRE